MSRYQNSTWTMRREIVVTWLIAAALLAVLSFLPAHDGFSPDQTLSAVSPAAAGTRDSDGPGDTGTSSCLERDYANERC